MTRQVLNEYEGALHHVMARGNRRNRIFASPDEADEARFFWTPSASAASAQDFASGHKFLWAIMTTSSSRRPRPLHIARRSWIWKKVRLRSGNNSSAQVRKPSRTIQQRTYAGNPTIDKDAPRKMPKIGNRSLPSFLTSFSWLCVGPWFGPWRRSFKQSLPA